MAKSETSREVHRYQEADAGYDNAGHLVRMQTLNMQEEHPGMDIWDVGKGLYTVTLAKGDRSYSGSMVVE